jgi:DNA modification methylase
VSDRAHIRIGDCLEWMRSLPAESVHCVVTSPPYWGLRDYGVDGQLGLESSPAEYIAKLVEIMREVRRVLRRDGTLWLNLGDTYIGGRNGGIGASSITSQRNQLAARQAWVASGGRTHRAVDGLKPKDLVGIPWRVALALQADGWWLRSDIVWHKPSPMPESVRDRPSRAHEYMFLLTRSESYYYDADAIRTPLRDKTYTAHGAPPRKSKGTDALGRVAAHNIARDCPDRKPRVDAAGEPVGANARDVWRLDQIEAPDVWTIAQEPYPHSHFATFPRALVEPCVLAGSPVGGLVLDPFAGSGTVGEVALLLGRRALLLELNPAYRPLIERRLSGVQYPLIAPGSEAVG